MKKSLFFLLALVMVFSFTLGAAANPVKDNLYSTIRSRNMYLTVTHLTPGLIRYSCGWDMDNDFVAQLHYVTGLKNLRTSENILLAQGVMEGSERDLDLSFKQKLFPHDEYSIFFNVVYMSASGWSPVCSIAHELP